MSTNFNKWSKIKIRGNVITEDGIDLKGFAGLEVLKEYDPYLVGTTQVKYESNVNKFLERKSNKKVKRTSEKTFQVEYFDGLQLSDDDENQNGSGSVRRKVAKKSLVNKKKVAKQGKVQRKFPEDDRFKLLRPPISDTEFESKEEFLYDNELNETTTVTSNDLEVWTRLGVSPEILKALAEQGFKAPTEIQMLTLPAAIMGKKDILGAAETGSGKTLAFGIPLLIGIMELKKKNVQSGIRKPLHKRADILNSYSSINESMEKNGFSDDEYQTDNDDELDNLKPLYGIILTPTRELAVQVKDHLIAAARYTGIQIIAVFGGLSLDKQERLLNKRPEIVVATPGRFWDLYQQGHKHLRKLDDISFLVIDETDRMVEKGHFEELRNILKVLNADDDKKQSRQNFIFSATLTLVHDLPEHMQKKNFGKRPRFIKVTSDMKIQQLIEDVGISQPKIVDITTKQQMAQNITECRLICPLDHKDYYLYYFVQRHPGRTIVFCNSIDCVKRLATLFGLLQCQPLPLHANMAQKQRLKNLERFRDNSHGLLIATDVAARGLDIPNVEHVIHYQVPRTSENYVHRSGRTARANKQGITVILMEPGEIKNYVKLHKTLQKTEDLPLFPVNEYYLATVKQRVNLARVVDKEELKLKRAQTEISWMRKHADEMDMIIEGYNDTSDNDGDDGNAEPFITELNRTRLLNIRTELKILLKKPIFPQNFSFKYPTSTGSLDVSANNSFCESNSAVKVLQQSVEDMKEAKRLRNKHKKTISN